jgi:hypothetical protein
LIGGNIQSIAGTKNNSNKGRGSDFYPEDKQANLEGNRESSWDTLVSSVKMIPAMIMFAVMCSYLLGMPSSMVAARESGLYRSYRIKGVPSWASMVAPVLANALHMLVVSILITQSDENGWRWSHSCPSPRRCSLAKFHALSSVEISSNCQPSRRGNVLEETYAGIDV